MKKNFKIETTADGSCTLFNSDIDEHYHSINGAIQESKHVFINAGLLYLNKKETSILEIGFGTGLNAYLTLQESIKDSKIIHYSAIELFPVPEEIIEKVNYPQIISPSETEQFYILHTILWNDTIGITPLFDLTKFKSDFTELNFLTNSESFDLIYFDAFAPDKQPEMWTQTIFDYLYKHTNENGVLVTYCAKGTVRRMMQHSGYRVERIPGPIGKREMLRATKL